MISDHDGTSQKGLSHSDNDLEIHAEHKHDHGHDHKHDHGHSHDHGDKATIKKDKKGHNHEENINIRAAIVHVIGDMLQSIGVIVASIIIFYFPSAKIADPICTYLFSILVMFTTIPVFKDCMHVLMEQQPKGVDSDEIKKDIMEVEGIHSVSDLHIWALSGGKNVLTAHIFINKVDKDTNYRALTHRVYHQVQKRMEKYDICHSTF
jgi:zinc transporter 2